MKTKPNSMAYTCVRKPDGETVLIGPVTREVFEKIKLEGEYEDFLEATWVPEGETVFINADPVELRTVKWYSNGYREIINKKGEVVFSETNPNWEFFRLNFKDGSIKSRYVWGEAASQHK